MVKPRKWTHKKTGNEYYKIGEAVNTTNGLNDCEVMVIYCTVEQYPGGIMYVRSTDEFKRNFEMED